MQLIEYVAVVAICYFLGTYVGKFLNYATKDIQRKRPDDISEDDWNNFVDPDEKSGKYLGTLERILAFAAFYSGAHTLLGGWFALKVASKWQVWATVIKMPDKLSKTENFSYLLARQKWGALLHMRFLIGTAINVLIGLILAEALKQLLA